MKESMKKFLKKELNFLNDKRYYFMAGLPRSGSTVLSSILNQNPKFYSGPSSPVVGSMIALEHSFSNDELFLGYPKMDQAKQIIASILPQFYSDRSESVIIDKNRSWTLRLEYIYGYFDIHPKVICPVRDINEILTSFIMMLRRNPYQVDGRINFIDEMLIRSNIPLTDENRCHALCSESGILGSSVEGIRRSIMQGYENCLHFVEYNDLISNPQETMNKIYEFLGEEPFEHHFDGLVNVNRENDKQIYGFADMHEVRPKLESTSKNPEEVLPREILDLCRGVEFWRTLSGDKNDDIEENYNDEEYLDYTDIDENNSTEEVQIIGT